MNGIDPAPPPPSAARLARNATWLIGGEILGRVTALVVAVYLARTLGAAGYGRIGTAMAFVSYLLIVVNAGLDPFGSRSVARGPGAASAIYAQVASARFALSLAMYPVLAGLLFVLPDDAAGGRALALIFGGRFFVQALSAGWALRGLDRMRQVATGVWIRELAAAVGVLALVRGPHPTLLLVPLVFVASEGLQTLYYATRLRHAAGPLRLRIHLAEGRDLVRESAPIALSKGLRLLFYEGDVLLVAWMAGSAQAGLFFASHRIVIALAMAFGTLLQENAFPTLSRLYDRDPVSAAGFLDDVNRAGLALVLPLAVAVSALSGDLVPFLFGEGFRDAGPVLAVTVFVVPVWLVLAGFNSELLAAGREGRVLRAEAMGTVAHLASALAMVPVLGALGAARANLLGRLAAGVGAGYAVGRLRGRFPASPRILSLLAGAGAMALAVRLAPTPLIGVGAGAAAYVAIVGLSGGVRIEELRRLLRRGARS